MAQQRTSYSSKAPAAKKPVAVAKPVQFRIMADEGARVFLVGSFNKWNPKKHELTFKDGAHTITLTLPKGRHEYKFLVNDQWWHDPNSSESVVNEYGSLNSVIMVD